MKIHDNIIGTFWILLIRHESHETVTRAASWSPLLIWVRIQIILYYYNTSCARARILYYIWMAWRSRVQENSRHYRCLKFFKWIFSKI